MVGVSVGWITWVDVEVGGTISVAVGCGVRVGVGAPVAVDVAVDCATGVAVTAGTRVGVHKPVDAGVAVLDCNRCKPPDWSARIAIKAQAATTSTNPTASSRTSSRELDFERGSCPLVRSAFCAMGALLRMQNAPVRPRLAA
jgi:hypothetical protein